jgi:ankyrin repeat protein
MVEFHLDMGANLEARDKRGQTAFDFAFSEGNEDVVRVLEERRGKEASRIVADSRRERLSGKLSSR